MPARARPWLLGTLAAVHLALLSACATTPPARSAPRCTYGSWTAPRPVGADPSGPGVLARYPSLASTRGGRAYLAGNEIKAHGPDTVPESPLVVWQVDGASIGRPPGPFRFAFPQLFVDKADRLRLVWGEPAAGTPRPTTARWGWQKPATLWSATYTPERGWSPPRQLFEGRAVAWMYATPAMQQGWASERWLLSVSDEPRVGGPPEPNRLVLLRLEGSAITPTTIETPLQPAATSLAAAGQTLYLGVVSPVSPAILGRAEADANSVLLLVSHDGGRTWDPPQVISRSGQNPAFKLQTLLAPDGTLHLVWRQTRAGRGEVIRHVASHDGGQSWSAPADLPSPGMLLNEFRAVMDDCGTLHVVYEHLDLTGAIDVGHLDYVTKGAAEGWSAVAHLFSATWDAWDATLHRAPDGRLLLGFLAKPLGAPPSAPWAALYSELPVRRD